MDVKGYLFKDGTTYAMWITRPVVVGAQQNLSRTLYPGFDTAQAAVDWFHKVHPGGILHEPYPLSSL